MNTQQRMACLLLPCFLGLLPLSHKVSAQSSPETQTVQKQPSDEIPTSEASSLQEKSESAPTEAQIVQEQLLDKISTPEASSVQGESGASSTEEAIETASDNEGNPAQVDDAEPALSEAEPALSNEDNATPANPEQAVTNSADEPEGAPSETDEAEFSQRKPEPQIVSARLPISTAVVVTFCSPVRFDSKQKQPFPVTAVLSHPISDPSGTVVAPMRSLANLQIQPKRRMVEIQVNSLIVDGRLVPVQTTPMAIPVLSRTHPDAQNSFFDSSSVPTEGVALNVVNNLQNWVGDQGLISSGASDLLGVGLSIASGVTSAFHSPQGKKISELPPGVSLIFALDTPVRLPAVRVDPSYAAEQAGADPCQQGNGSNSDDYSDDYSGASSSFGSDEP